MVFSCNFFEITKETFFIKYLRATIRQLKKSQLLLVEDIIFQPF